MSVQIGTDVILITLLNCQFCFLCDLSKSYFSNIHKQWCSIIFDFLAVSFAIVLLYRVSYFYYISMYANLWHPCRIIEKTPNHILSNVQQITTAKRKYVWESTESIFKQKYPAESGDSGWWWRWKKLFDEPICVESFRWAFFSYDRRRILK